MRHLNVYQRMLASRAQALEAEVAELDAILEPRVVDTAPEQSRALTERYGGWRDGGWMLPRLIAAS